MTPIFFPMTYVTDSVMTALKATFSKTVVYQPAHSLVPEDMNRYLAEGILDIRFPATGDEEKLKALLEETKDWLTQHQGRDLSAYRPKLFQGDDIPFYGDTSTTQIKADIRKPDTVPQPDKAPPDRLFAARFFLLTAQENDIQQDELTHNLKTVSALESQLFENLKGGEADEGIDINALKARGDTPYDPGSHHTEERMAAWYRLFNMDPAAEAAETLLVTTSPAVFDMVREKITGVVSLPSVNGAIISDEDLRQQWQDRIQTYMLGCAENPDTPPDPPSFSGDAKPDLILNLLSIPASTLHYLFTGSSDDVETPGKPNDDHLLVGLLVTREGFIS